MARLRTYSSGTQDHECDGLGAPALTILVIEGGHGQGWLHVFELDLLPLLPTSPEI